MAKPARKLTPDERAKAFAVERARPPASDPFGEWAARCQLLARETGAAFTALYDQWQDRAAILQYDAGTTREQADEAAYQELVADLKRQGRLL